MNPPIIPLTLADFLSLIVFFYSLPQWAVNLLDFKASFFARPYSLSTLGLSDHAILSVTISSKAPSKVSKKAISIDLIHTPFLKNLLTVQ